MQITTIPVDDITTTFTHFNTQLQVFCSTVLLSPQRLATRMHTRRHCRAAADTLRLRLLLPTVDLSRSTDLRPYCLDPILSSVHSALL